MVSLLWSPLCSLSGLNKQVFTSPQEYANDEGVGVKSGFGNPEVPEEVQM